MNLLPDLVEYDETEGYRLEQDPTGLLNEGFRYRDPETGTFLTRDPLGFKAGPNMYTYVRQNPWTHFDPEGLDSTSAQPTFSQKVYAAASQHSSELKHNLAVAIFPPLAIVDIAKGMKESLSMVHQGTVVATHGFATGDVRMGLQGTAVAAAAGAMFLLGGEGVRGATGAVTTSLKAAAPAATARGTAETNTTVGRWMSPAEYNKTVSTSTVQESRSGTTHVTSPADSSVFKPTAPPGSVHAQFDVPATSVKPTSASGVAKIIGPNSLEGRLAASKGQPVPQMPPASNIKITDNKPPVKPVQPQQQSH